MRAALLRRYIDHSSVQTMRGEFLREMPSTEAVNWNRSCVCVRVCACSLALYVRYPKITLTLQQEDRVDISQWAYGTLAQWSGSLRSNPVQYNPYCVLYHNTEQELVQIWRLANTVCFAKSNITHCLDSVIKQFPDKQAMPHDSDRQNVYGLNQSCLCELLITRLSAFDTTVGCFMLLAVSLWRTAWERCGLWYACVSSLHMADTWR